jgi:hypothetical protein
MNYGWQRTSTYGRVADVDVLGYGGDAQAIVTKLTTRTFEMKVYGITNSIIGLLYESPIYKARDFDAALIRANHMLARQRMEAKNG